MVKQVQLASGDIALVDDADYDAVSVHKWFSQRSKYGVYANACIDGVQVGLHRFLMKPLKLQEVDHRNGNPLDNRRENLRICSHKENVRNKRKQPDTSSRFKGVHLAKRRWQVQIEQNGVQLRIGSFLSEFEAARSYDRAAIVLFGEFAKTNASLGLFDAAEDRVMRLAKVGRPGKRRHLLARRNSESMQSF